jgi:hypothetical protein
VRNKHARDLKNIRPERIVLFVHGATCTIPRRSAFRTRREFNRLNEISTDLRGGIGAGELRG